MSAPSLPSLVARLGAESSALAALGACLEARLSGRALAPELASLLARAARSLGAEEDLNDASEVELRALLAEVRLTLLSNLRLVFHEDDGGWGHGNARLLDAAGEVSSTFPARLHTIARDLDGLASSLSAPGATFLDIGVGVAAMAVEMARTWPTLHVVGLEPLAPALALARERVRTLGLVDRIELRQQEGQTLTERDTYDLAWLPSAFIPGAQLSSVLARVHESLRPGAYVLLPVLRPGHDALSDALCRLRAYLFGGSVLEPACAATRLVEHGFVEVRTLPGPEASPIALVVGRRRAV